MSASNSVLTPASVAATLQQCLSGGVLTLADTAFGNISLTALFDAFLVGKTLTLSGATITITAQGATVVGTGFGGAKVNAEFSVASGVLGLVLTATLPAGWKLSTALPVLAGTVVDLLPALSGTLTLQTDAQGGVGPDSLTFDGSFAIGAATFAVSVANPGGFSLKGTLPTTTLASLVGTFAPSSLALPSGFNLTFTNSTVLIQDANGSLSFQLGTVVDNVGAVAFCTLDQGGKWGFALGLEVAVGALASLPGLSGLASFEKMYDFENALLVVSSESMSGFTFPDLNGTAIKLPTQASGVEPGLEFYATINLLEQGSLTEPLANLLHLSVAAITLDVGADPATQSSLTAAVSGNISSNLPFTGSFTIANTGGVLSFSLTGSVPTTIQGQPVTFDASMQVLATGAVLSADAKGQIKFSTVTLDDLALAVGIDDAGIPSIGVAATIVTSDFDGSVAIFFDSAAPSQSMFLAAVSNTNLAAIVQSLSGAALPSSLASALQQVTISGSAPVSIPSAAALVTALEAADVATVSSILATSQITISSTQQEVLIVANTAGQNWSLTDLSTQRHYQLTLASGTMAVELQAQFYCAPQATQIGTLKFPEGTYLNVQLGLFGLTVAAQVEVSPNQGISADVTMSPVQIMGGSVLSITGLSGAGGPSLSLSTFNDPSQSTPALQAPHCFLNGDISVLGVSQTQIVVSVTESGLTFAFSTTAGADSFTLNGTVVSLTDFSLKGTAVVQVGTLNLGSLGSLPVNSGVNLTFTATSNGTTVSGSAQGTVTILGQSFNVNESIGVSNNTLADLSGAVVSFLEGEVVKWLGSDVTSFLASVKNGVLQGFSSPQTIGQVLAGQFGLTPSVIGGYAQNALSYGATQIAAVLQGAGASQQEIASVLSGLGYTASEITSAISQWFSSVHVDFAVSHVDTTQPPHGDTNTHIDVPSTHVDGSKWGIHGDVGTPHGDTNTHIDTPSVHVDTGGHVDIN